MKHNLKKVMDIEIVYTNTSLPAAIAEHLHCINVHTYGDNGQGNTMFLMSNGSIMIELPGSIYFIAPSVIVGYFHCKDAL